MDKNYAYEVAYTNGYMKGREDALKEILSGLHKPFMALINKFNEYVEAVPEEETFMTLVNKFNEYIEETE